MSKPDEKGTTPSRIFCVLALVVGILALAVEVAYGISGSDLGGDLGIDGRGTRRLLHAAGLPVALLGLLLSSIAMAIAPTWRTRFVAPLPGVIASGAAVAAWFMA